MSSNTHSRQGLPDTRSKLDLPKPNSNSTDLDDSDAVNALSVDESVASEASPAPTGVLVSGAPGKNEFSSDAVAALSTDSPGFSEGTSQALVASTNLPYHLVDMAEILVAWFIGDGTASQQHLSSEGIQAQPTTQEIEEDIGPKGGLSRTKANNLYTTFAFLVEAYATSSRKLVNGKLNKDAIAKRLQKIAAIAYNNNGEPLPGQGDEAIKDRIEDAMKIKKSKLPQK